MSSELGPLHRRPDVVTNEQGFSHLLGWMRVKKVVQNQKRNQIQSQNQNHRLRIGSWNIGTLTGKAMEVVDVMIRRKIYIMCLQETRWVGKKVKTLSETGYKIWYTGNDRAKNGVRIIMDKSLVDEVVDVKRIEDRIIMVKVGLARMTMNIFSTYTPQAGLREEIKVKFWEDLEGLI